MTLWLLAPCQARATSYTGAPDLALSLSMDMAGGGPDRFTADALIKALFAPRHADEMGALRRRFGLAEMQRFYRVGGYAVPHAMTLVEESNVPVPDNPSPPPSDAPALSAALYHAGVGPDGRFDVTYMLEKLASQSIALRVDRDVTARFGAEATKTYHEVLASVFADLKTVYRL
jgi:hypothetical protein